MTQFLTLLTEPIALMVVAMVLGACLSRRGRGRARALLPWVPALLLSVLCATPLGANALLRPLEERATRSRSACAASTERTVVVVLAGGVSDRASSSDDIASLQQASFRRVIAGVERSLAIPESRMLVSGGGRSAVRESQLLGVFAIRLGYPQSRLVTEDGSRTTAEGASSVAALLRRLNATRVELVTAAAHMPRALASFQAAGVSACPIPMDFEYVDVRLPMALMPQISSVEKSTHALHEYLGWIVYIVSGIA